MKRRPPKGNVRRVRHIDGNLRYVAVNEKGETFQCESHGERRATLVFGHSRRRVKNFTSQPETFHWILSDGTHIKYTPDFMVWLVDGTIEIHEITIKHRRESNDNIRRREDAGRAICAARRWKYIVHTEDDLPGDAETANLLAFRCYRARIYSKPEIAHLVRHSLRDSKQTTVNNLVSEIVSLSTFSRPDIYKAIFHMIWQDELQIEWTRLFFLDAAPQRDAKVWLT